MGHWNKTEPSLMFMATHMLIFLLHCFRLNLCIWIYSILCRNLESHHIYLYFAGKLGNRCSSLLRRVQTYIEIQYVRQK